MRGTRKPMHRPSRGRFSDLRHPPDGGRGGWISAHYGVRGTRFRLNLDDPTKPNSRSSPVEVHRVRFREVPAPPSAQGDPDGAQPAPVFGRNLTPVIPGESEVKGAMLHVARIHAGFVEPRARSQRRLLSSSSKSRDNNKRKAVRTSVRHEGACGVSSFGSKSGEEGVTQFMPALRYRAETSHR